MALPDPDLYPAWRRMHSLDQYRIFGRIVLPAGIKGADSVVPEDQGMY